ncbi:hypothetical protein V3C99_008503 [Haemonchus contortus]
MSRAPVDVVSSLNVCNLPSIGGDTCTDLLKRLEAEESLPSYVKLIIGVLIETKMEISDLNNLCKTILAENKVLREENNLLRSQLNSSSSSEIPTKEPSSSSQSAVAHDAGRTFPKIDPDLSRSIVVSGVPEGKPLILPRSQPRLKCLLSNVRSIIKNNWSLVCTLLHTNYDIVLLTETWLNSKHDTAPLLGIVSSQFEVIRCDRLYKKGGGVLILVKNTISFVIVYKDSLKDAYEIIVVDFFVRHFTFRLILVYRTPLCNAYSSSLLLKVISDFSSYEAPCLVVGDFNLADVDWNSTDCSAGYCAVTKEFLEVFRSHNFVQFVKSPTRGPSYLDLIFCNEVALIGEVEVLPPIGSSDHASASFTLNVEPLAVAQRKWVRDFGKARYDAVEEHLSSIDWVGSFATVDTIDEKYELFLSVLHDAVDRYVPLRRASCTRYRFPSYLDRMVRRRCQLWASAVADDSVLSWEAYKVFDKKVRKAIVKYSAYLEKKFIESKNPNKLFAYINNRLKKSVKIPALNRSESEVVILDDIKAEVLADQFQRVFTENSSLILADSSSCGTTMESSLWFYKEEIYELLTQWPDSHSVTPDFLPLKFIKRIAFYIAFPLEILFNLSYMRSEVPSRWKHSFIIPIPKKPPFSNPANYRPISITSIFARLFEKIVKVRLTKYLEQHNIIPSCQHGFRAGRSTETALLCSLNDWSRALDARKRVHVIYFDFAKAFDRVPHKKLIHKLELLGVYPLIVRWIESFLSGRTYQVRVGSKLSSIRKIPSGVPQGGVLSPTLFLAYTADLPTCVARYQVSCAMYADDIKLYKVIESLSDCDMLQAAIDHVVSWSELWELPLAPDKTKVFSIGNNSLIQRYKIGSVVLEPVNEVRDLGFVMSNKLAFDSHYKALVSRANNRIYNLFKTLQSKNPAILLKAYKAYVRPIVESGTSVFFPFKKKDVQLLESVQNSFTRKLILRCSALSFKSLPSGVERRHRYALPSLTHRRHVNDLVMAFKILTGRVAVDSADFFTLVKSRTRGSTVKIRFPIVRTQVRAKSFAIRVLPLLNKIYDENIMRLTLGVFRRKAINLVKAEIP